MTILSTNTALILSRNKTCRKAQCSLYAIFLSMTLMKQPQQQKYYRWTARELNCFYCAYILVGIVNNIRQTHFYFVPVS